MQTLLIASSNPGKLREMQYILHGLPLRLVLPIDVGIPLDVLEDGDSYLANAQKKALAYQHASGLLTLADDSGLAVDALDGAPGIISARFSPKAGANDADRRAYLLQKLVAHPQPWTAHFHCSLVLASPQGAQYHFSAKCFGQIIAEERGDNGFGYDPIFFMPALGKTMAELPDQHKNQISHRALALLAARPTLQQLAME